LSSFLGSLFLSVLGVLGVLAVYSAPGLDEGFKTFCTDTAAEMSVGAGGLSYFFIMKIFNLLEALFLSPGLG
jgi:hypothetical protein